MSEPETTFYISGDNTPVHTGSELWDRPLPMDRKYEGKGVVLTYGGYFTAVKAFLERNNRGVLLSAVESRSGKTAIAGDIESIRIRLEKHGQFYHPGRVEVTCFGETLPLVVNVAVSPEGTECILREYPILEKLAATPAGEFIPKVYGYGEVEGDGGNTAGMFLGRWFDGFYEFHISRTPAGDEGIIVWDTADGSYFLNPSETFELYRQAAVILTCCYDVSTFEQVQPWHHAAGDFIVRRNENGIDLRLITIRNHGTMFESEERDPSAMLEGLLLFLVNLSIRTRLDRIDGIKETAWAGEIALEATVKGFFDALEVKGELPGTPLSLSEGMEHFLSARDREDLMEAAAAVVGACNPDAPDVPVIRENLLAHVERLGDFLGL